jgi:hypothetical protein
VVVFGAHPDDPESGCGGLIALLTQKGHEVIVGYATCYRGDPPHHYHRQHGIPRLMLARFKVGKPISVKPASLVVAPVVNGRSHSRSPFNS